MRYWFILLCSLPMVLWADSPNLRQAQRIITLSPHLADLAYSAGVEDKLVGVVRYTSPRLMQNRAVVGDAFSLNIEQVLRLKPDLILAWKEGTPNSVLTQLQSLGLNVHSVQTKTLEDIPLAISSLSATPRQPLPQLRARIQRLTMARPTRRLFIQFGNQPSYTLSGRHILSDGLARCGFTNIFAGLTPIAPQVDVEMVLRHQPDVVLAITDDPVAARKFWQDYLPAMPIIHGEPDDFAQPDVDMISAIAKVCESL